MCVCVYPYPLMHVHGGGGATQRWPASRCFPPFLFIIFIFCLFICLKESLSLNLHLAASARWAGWPNCPWDPPIFSTQHQGYRHGPPHCLLHGYWDSKLRSWHLPSKHFICSTALEFTLKENKTKVFTKAFVIYLIIILSGKPKRKAQSFITTATEHFTRFI